MLVPSDIYVDGPYGVYAATSGNYTAYQLPPFNPKSETPGIFGTSSTMEAKRQNCGTYNDVQVGRWPDTGRTIDFCNNKDPNDSNNFETSSYLFPSLWSKWKISSDITSQAHSINYDQLALAIVFQYVGSSEALSASSPSECFNECIDTDVCQYPPLLGQQWCTDSNCTDCRTTFNNTAPQMEFFRCNMWDANDNEICQGCSPGYEAVDGNCVPCNPGQYGKPCN